MIRNKVAIFLFFILRGLIGFCQLNQNEKIYNFYDKKNICHFLDKRGKEIFSLDSINSMHFQAMHYSSFINNKIAFNNFSGGFPKGYKILNSKGEIIFNSNESYFLYQYTNYDPLENGYAIVSDKTSRGIINNDGKIVLKLSFENKDLSECGEGIFVRKKSDTLEFISANGNRLFVKYNVIPEYYLKSFKFLNGITKYYDGKTNLYGYLSSKGNLIIYPQFETAFPFNEDFALVKTKEDKYFKIINKKGEVQFNKYFKDANPGNESYYSDNLLNVRDIESNLCGYIDKNGEWKIKPIYTNALSFKNGLGLGFLPNGSSQIIDLQGNIVIKGLWSAAKWDQNVIFDTFLGSYYNRQGQIIFKNKVPYLRINNLLQLESLENPERVNYIELYLNEIIKSTKILKCVNLNELMILGYSNWGETVLPKKIFDLKSLKYLTINLGNLKIIPEEITKLENLQLLNLKGNKIEKLPIDLAKLKKLYFLKLTNNNIKSLPENIDKYENLGSLNVDNNPILKLPEAIYRIKNLSYFGFGNTPFNTDKNVIAKLKLAYPKAILDGKNNNDAPEIVIDSK